MCGEAEMQDADRKIAVHAIKMAQVDGANIVPTVVFYKKEDPLIGNEAIKACCEPQYLNEDFKLELGMHPLAKLRDGRKRVSETGYMRSALGVTSDFFRATMKAVSEWSHDESLGAATHVLIAEPVSLDKGDVDTEAWLKNYRAAIRAIAADKFQGLGFLPEPFAVYQYYRYDFRSPVVSQNKKRVAGHPY